MPTSAAITRGAAAWCSQQVANRSLVPNSGGANDVQTSIANSQRAAKVGRYLKEKLETLGHPRLKEVRGRGLILAVEFADKARPLVELLMAEGILAKDTHEYTVRFAPPLTLTEEQADEAFARISRAVAAFGA